MPAYTTNENGLITAVHGLSVTIQAKAGSYRTKQGKSPILMSDHYGEIIGTKGADNDPLDCYIGPYPESENVYIINQQTFDGRFDEHKVMFGFVDQDHAVNVYRLGCFDRQPLSVVSCTVAQFKWWIENGNHKAEITPQSLPFDTYSEIAMQQFKDYDWQNASAAASRVLYDMRVMDSAYGQLVEPMDFTAIIDEVTHVDGGEFSVMDALVIPNGQIEKKAKQIGLALNRQASGEIKVVDDGGVEVTEPYRQNGTTNVAMIFNLSDGQTVSVFMHNPDANPKKLAPTDNLVSWKWLLNKKDITIVVAKENGQDQAINTIAKKIMALVEANSAKFQRTNAKAAELEAEIKATEARIEEKKNVLQGLLDQIGAIKNGAGKNEDNQGITGPIAFNGNELGEFDVSTIDGKKQMREAARNVLENLRGKWVKCPAMPRDENGQVREVEIRNRSIKEFISHSGNPIKMLLAAKIEAIIETAKNAVEEPNIKIQSKPNVLRYFKLVNEVTVKNEKYQVSVIIEQDTNGYLHYDVMLPEKAKATLDSVALQPEPIPAHKAGASGQFNNIVFDDIGQEISQDSINLIVKKQNSNGEWVELDDEPIEQNNAIENNHSGGNEFAGESEQPYSVQINQELITNYGWQVQPNQMREDRTPTLQKTFKNVKEGGKLNPDGDLTVFAKWNDNSRYLSCEIGWETPFDIDCRDGDPKLIAQEFNERAEKAAKGQDPLSELSLTDGEGLIIKEARPILEKWIAKKNLNWDQEAKNTFLLRTLERIKDAVKSPVTLSIFSKEVLNNGVNDMTRAVFDIFTDGEAEKVSGTTQKRGHEIVMQYAIKLFGQERVDKDLADYAANAERAKEEQKQAELVASVKDNWFAIGQASRNTIIQWLNDGWYIEPIKRGVATTYTLTNGTGRLKESRNANVKNVKAFLKGAYTVYGGLGEALLAIGAIDKLPEKPKDEEEDLENQVPQEELDRLFDNNLNRDENVGDPDLEADKEFLNSVINGGDHDVLSAEFESKIMAIAEKYNEDSGNAEMTALVNQAVDAYVAKLDELSKAAQG